MRMLLSILLMMAALVVLYFAVSRTIRLIKSRKRRRQQDPTKRFKKGLDQNTATLYLIAMMLVLVSLFLPDKRMQLKENLDVGDIISLDGKEDIKQDNRVVVEPGEEFVPKFVATGTPSSNHLKKCISWQVLKNGRTALLYEREEPISFGDGDDYFVFPGIATFRGNNYRDGGSYGPAVITEENLASKWSSNTQSLENTSWSGFGWTGQPLIVKWDDETRQSMNLYYHKENKENLVEVICPSLDGRIYFFDLDDGAYTRPPIDIGQCLKGTGALDPRGYPLLYVGAGDESRGVGRPRMYVISLIDGSILYEYGHNDHKAYRKDNDEWCAFDSSPLIDAETDTLIWPGENGVLYTIKLNTVYDKELGTITVTPDDPVTTRYHTPRSGEDTFRFGYEASISAVENFIFISENGGMFFCIDLNTMQPVWVLDTVDDGNSSPVIEYISAEECYVYTASTLNWTQDENHKGTASIYKIDAVTGEVVWQTTYDVSSTLGLSGGLHSTPILGKPGTVLEGLIIYTIARTPEESDGQLIALDTETGEEVWRFKLSSYSSSSPTAVYTASGKAYIIACDATGYMYLVNGENGRRMYSITLGSGIEASPAVYGNTIVVGNRDKKVWAIEIK